MLNAHAFYINKEENVDFILLSRSVGVSSNIMKVLILQDVMFKFIHFHAILLVNLFIPQ